MAKLQVTPIIGLPQFNGWSQVTTNSRHSLVCSIAIFGPNAGNIGRDLVATIDQATPSSAAELHSFLQQLMQEVEQAGAQPALACLLASENQSILATYHGSILLKRNGKVGIIVSSNSELKVIEGSYIAHDSLVLATAQATNFLGEIQQKIKQGYDLDTIITSLVPAIHAAENSSLTSLGFVTLGDWEAEPEPEPEVEPEPELEITLETIVADREDAIIPPLLDDIKKAEDTEPEKIAEIPDLIESITPAAEAGVSLPSDSPTPKPIDIIWTKSSKSTFLPGFGEIIRKILGRFRSGTTKVAGVARSRLGRVKWRQFQPQLLWARITNRDVYVAPQSRRQVLKFVIPLLLVIIVVIIGVIFWRGRQAQQVQAAEAAIQPAVAQFQAAKDQVSSDPLVARQRMEDSLGQLEALETEFKNQPAGRRVVQAALSAAQSEYEDLSGRDELQSLPVFFEAGAIESDWISSQADLSGTQLALLDPGKNQVALVDINTKEVKRIPAFSSQPVDMIIDETHVTTLGGGVWQSTIAAATAPAVVIEEGDSNRDGSLLGGFGPYLYVLNPVKRNIFRYTAQSEGGYSDPIGWFKPGQQFNYDNLYSLQIDGDIWLGTTDGQIIQLTSGEVMPFEVKGLPEAFNSSLVVYTKENLQYLYVLEPASHRMVILQKTGEFVRQVTSGSLAAATDIAVSEEAGKAFALSGSLVFEIGL